MPWLGGTGQYRLEADPVISATGEAAVAAAVAAGGAEATSATISRREGAHGRLASFRTTVAAAGLPVAVVGAMTAVGLPVAVAGTTTVAETAGTTTVTETEAGATGVAGAMGPRTHPTARTTVVGVTTATNEMIAIAIGTTVTTDAKLISYTGPATFFAPQSLRSDAKHLLCALHN